MLLWGWEDPEQSPAKDGKQKARPVFARKKRRNRFKSFKNVVRQIMFARSFLGAVSISSLNKGQDAAADEVTLKPDPSGI